MNRAISGFICALGLLLAFGVDVSNLICYGTVFLVLGGVVHYLIRGKLPPNFWLLLFGVLVGPFLLAALLHAVYRKITYSLYATFGRYTVVVLFLGFLAVSALSFCYVRSRFSGLLSGFRKQDAINERQPVLTLLEGRSEESCVELESLNDYSIED
ncbi:MAG: hypothetical protein DMF64_19700 [Acidobacteria bacterium]|nr:MAG: hypothetical protein DMF64_19700 [Acidobacteriota bacterium]